MRLLWYIVALGMIGAATLLTASTRNADRPAPVHSVATNDPWRSAADLFFRVAARDEAIPDAGLPRSVAQDGGGFIWLATDAGLGRWDGTAFKTYTTERTPTAGALPEPMVNLVFADRSGRLWLGMSAEGLLWHDPATEQFYRPVNRTPLDSAHILAITDDGSGGLWVGSDRGLANVTGGDHRVAMVVPGDATGLPRGAAHAVLVDRRGAIWVTVGTRLFRRTSNVARFEPVSLGPNVAAVSALHEDARGRVWIVTTGSGVTVVDVDGTIRWVSLTGMGRSPVLGTMIDAGNGEVWIASRSGIVAVDITTRRVRNFVHDPAIPGSLPENGLNQLMRDRSGLVWIVGDATLAYVDPAPRRVLGIVGALRPAAGRAPEAAWAVGAAPDGTIWYGSADTAAARLVPNKNDAALPVHRTAVPGARSGVLAFAFWPGWGTYMAGEDGLFVLPSAARSAIRLSASPWTRLLLQDTTLYVGGNGVASLDVRAPAAPVLAPWSAELTDPRVKSLVSTADGSLWVGTASGLNRVDLATGAVTHVRPRSTTAPDLRANFISTLLVDNAGRLWAGTIGGGLTVFRRDGRTWHSAFHLGRQDGMPHDTIDKLLLARNGRIWASTDGGIVQIDPRSLTITPLRAADGVSFVANWTGAGDMLPDGRLVFAGFGGLTIIDPDLPQRSMGNAPLHFIAIRANGRGIIPSPTGRLTIGTDDRSLTAEFARLDYATSRDQAFAYRLLPSEQSWTRVDAQHNVARYTNLPPGESTLVVRALAPAPGGVMRPVGEPLTVTLDVERRWTETIAFVIVVGIATLTAGFFLLSLRMRSARQRERRLEHLVERRTAELRVSQSELEKLAYSDTLTGLSNRRHYGEVVGALLAHARHNPFALLLIDLDRFKQVNDQLGHDTGDALLVEVADRLTAAMRQRDSIFRLGGDEFAIVVTEMPDEQAIEDVCRRLYHAFTKRISAGDHEITVSLSIGAVIVNAEGQSMERIYKLADQALYDAKRAGRGTWRLAPIDA